MRLVEELNSYENHVDVLINNAGCNWGEAYQTFPEKAFQKVMTLNVKSVFLLTRAMTPLLQRGGSKDNPARVINIRWFVIIVQFIEFLRGSNSYSRNLCLFCIKSCITSYDKSFSI